MQPPVSQVETEAGYWSHEFIPPHVSGSDPCARCAGVRRGDRRAARDCQVVVENPSARVTEGDIL